VAFEIPQQQNQKNQDGKHEQTEVISGGAGAARLEAICHTYLDTFSGPAFRRLMNLKETLLYFSVSSGKQTKGHKGPAALFSGLCGLSG